MAKRTKRRRHNRNLSVDLQGVPCESKKASLPIQSKIRAINFTAESIDEGEITETNQIREWKEKSGVVWLHVDNLADTEVIREIGCVFGLHSLALEDVVHVHQRPKVEEYEDHLFLVLRTIQLEEELHSQQLSMFFGHNFVITFHENKEESFEIIREHLRLSRGRIRTSGADYLAYSILDAVVDSYFPVADSILDRIEVLDDEIGNHFSNQLTSELHRLRGNLMELRRSIRPLRDALIRLMPDANQLITSDTQFYLRDCFDHTVQLIDMLDTYRELCSDLRDYYLASVSNRMNEIMKVLTIIATIFMPLSFVAGVYGMNFNPEKPGNMPELNWPYGYIFALVVMLAIAMFQLFYFYRRGWLNSYDKVG